MKQSIAIVGSTGNMGTAIAKSLAKGNYRLLLFGRDETRTQKLAEEILSEHPDCDVEAIGCPKDASWEADIVVMATPYATDREIVEQIKPVVTQKVVVSIANPIKPNFDGMLVPPSTSAAEELQKLLPDAHVVKAFNTTFAANFYQPLFQGSPVDAFIAGDNKDAVAQVVELVKTVGFNPVVAGPLSASRTLENMQLLLMQLSLENGYNWHAGWKILSQKQL